MKNLVANRKRLLAIALGIVLGVGAVLGIGVAVRRTTSSAVMVVQASGLNYGGGYDWENSVSGVITTDTVFPDTEKIANQRYKSLSGYKDVWYVQQGEYAYTGIDEITRTGSTRRHTPMNMESSIIDSDNIFFSWAALKMGWDKYKDFLAFIGMGENVPFDLPTQRSQVKNAESSETYSLLAMTGYGQGELLVTPLQMACYIASFRNDGKAPVPYVVDSIWQAEGNDTEGCVVDPLFVNAERRDFHLKPESPVAKAGFRPFDIDAAGVRGGVAR